ncbi:metallophosphoesterase [Sneathiella marina]|uniref:Metallophosphoesterase n=1 Tax=Sneathiella marina TaxID=2950108 RepID=A0ABY4W282_9PROT|nr:metallophosphoesterase [Sneathiella marina]USG61295.1 metallophosphoesterase [Sneathiella marina]
MALPRISTMVSKLTHKAQGETIPLADARMPADELAFVIGDIHGRNDLLLSVIERITTHEYVPDYQKRHIVFLGDYVDRGKMSKEVIQTLIDLDLPEFNIVTLDGNHEASMRGFLENPVKGKRWLHYGGDATLRSYGIDVSLDDLTEADLVAKSAELEMALSPSHKKFLYGLTGHYSLGDFFFTHAGINPKRVLAEQSERDLLWIRSEFLTHDGLYEKVIVHGHSISAQPEFRDNRIGIDTGAFYSNDLTCLVLYGNSKKIL